MKNLDRYFEDAGMLVLLVATVGIMFQSLSQI